MLRNENLFSNVSVLLKRLIFILVVIFYFNLGFILLEPSLYANFRYLFVFLLFYFLIVVNALICPLFTGRRSKDLSPRTTIFLVVFDLLAPFGIMLPYFEYTIVFQKNFPQSSTGSLIMLGLGVLFMVVGGIVMIISRLILGTFGKATVVKDEQHQLITRGPYRYVRHPIYSSMILLISGYSLSFFSIASTFLFVLILVPFIMFRIKAEEHQLIELFGDQYRKYTKRTKRIIPFVY